MDFDEILCMQYCDITHEIFPNFSTELWSLIDVKISIFSSPEPLGSLVSL